MGRQTGSVSFGHLAEAGAGGVWASLGTVPSVLFSLDLLLAVFNLLPLPPLDGSGALPLFMSPG
ncbi:MAG TPA: hypothetical protein VGV85_14725, partial [Longimicrobiaceae bacterium]|nr:hypothetical protein [Longimicrobiaceae bacterium]